MSNMLDIPSNREEWVKMVREEFIAQLPDPDWADQVEVDENEVEKSANTLAALYRDLGFPMMWAIITLIVCLLGIDLLFYLSAQIYGLYIDVLAAIFFITPSFKSPTDMAYAVTSKKQALRIKEGEEMVSNNVGFLTLLCGFVIQGIAVQSQRTELLGENLLVGLPDALVFISLPLAGILAFVVLGKLRSYYQRERDDDLPVLKGESECLTD